MHFIFCAHFITSIYLYNELRSCATQQFFHGRLVCAFHQPPVLLLVLLAHGDFGAVSGWATVFSAL